MKPDTKLRDEEILRRAAAGESERSIAKAVGLSRSGVWAVKQKAKRAS